MEKIELKTKRLTLRPVQLGDENQIHEYAGDKEITMMFWLPNDTFEETVDFVKRNVEEWKSPDQKDFEFVIIFDGKIIGGCDVDLSYSEDHSYGTLGWVINKKYRKQGFASEAAMALLDFAFTNLKIQKIYAQCDCKNAASFCVMKKIGMTLVDDKGTRTYPKTGITSGEFTCMITKEEWKNGNSSSPVRNIIVLPYDKKWKQDFSDIATELETALGLVPEPGALALAIEHVGSTSVEGLSAKPIIDIDVVVKAGDVEAAIQALAGIGYTHEGNLGIEGREAFGYSGKEHLREHHLYVCPEDSPELKRHLAFRDYLRAHPQAVEEYSKIKFEAATLFPHDIDGYIAHKSPVIERIYKELGIDKK